MPLTPSRHDEESDATSISDNSIIRSTITKRNCAIDQAKEDVDIVITDVLGPNTNCDDNSDAMSVSTVISSSHSFREAHCYHNNSTTSIPSSNGAIIERRQDNDPYLHEHLYDFNCTLSPEARQMNPLYNFNHLSPQGTMRTDGAYYDFNHQIPQVNNPPLS
ncbi:9339_t:CDS:1, partial [Racocetra fulgida]